MPDIDSTIFFLCSFFSYLFLVVRIFLLFRICFLHHHAEWRAIFFVYAGGGELDHKILFGIVLLAVYCYSLTGNYVVDLLFDGSNLLINGVVKCIVPTVSVLLDSIGAICFGIQELRE